MKRFNVGIDVDGVLANFMLQARKDLQMLFNGRPEDHLIQTTWSFSSLGINAIEDDLFWRHVDNTENWWIALERMPGTDKLKELSINHRCTFVTKRKEGFVGLPIVEQTQYWLNYLFGIKDPVVVISGNKGAVALGLDLDFFIDDKPETVKEVAELVPNCISYLKIDTYNNKEFFVNKVFTFDDFANIVLERGKNAESSFSNIR